MCGLVVSGGHTPGVLPAANHPLDRVARAVAALFERGRWFPVVLVGKNGFGRSRVPPGPSIIAGRSLVGQKLPCSRERLPQRVGGLAVRSMAGGEPARERAALFIRRGVAFRRAPAPAPSKGFRTASV